MTVLPAGQAATLEAASTIKRGGIIAFKTDTLYGLGVDPLNRLAVERLKKIKGRDDGKPILLLISDEPEMKRVTLETTLIFEQASRFFWPGPITLVTRAHPEVPLEITAGTGTIGIRLPADSTVRELVRQCGGVLTATSANLAGQPPARNATEVLDQFDQMLDLVVDGGEVTVIEPSTVLDITTYPVRLIREGAIRRDVIETVFEVA
ncbi:MAG TPA: L-threonylcarbamoyladenylate synthase [Pyrinomonadaceae bacterium]|nr:L-threonylcarbamoyladenylate synthase [Pyrinomonadaceae bacterium]